MFNICYVFRIGQDGLIPPQDAEEQYQSTVKKLVSHLYANPKICVAFSISGIMLSWYEKNHPELLQILSELTNRKQVEIIGGGYFEPLFPLLMPIDRVGQIEKLSTDIRRTTGKRPRGIRLPQSAFDASLVSSIKTCGFDYAFLDASIIESATHEKNSNLIPYMVEESAKTLVVLPVTSPELINENLSVSEYLHKIKPSNATLSNYFYCTEIDLSLHKKNIESNKLSSFLEDLSFEESVELTTPQQFFKSNLNYKKIFIPSGCKIKNTGKNLFSAKELVLSSKEAQNLYSRILYSYMIINQFKGDKIRKKSAKEELWHAEHYSSYTDFGVKGVVARQKAYNSILNAENLLKDTKSKEKLNNMFTFDFDMDGQKEYIFNSKNYSAFVSALGGTVFELDLNNVCQNYAGEGRQLFTDYLLTKSEFENSYAKGKANIFSIFQKNRYSEIKFSKSKNEITFATEANFGKNKQSVQLKKSYMFFESGVQVQYILQNKSNKPLACILLIDFNIATNPNNLDDFKIEVATENRKYSPKVDYIYMQNNASIVQFCDTQLKTDLIFESNESANLCLQPLFVDNVCVSSCGAFYWEVEIPPAFEIEKTITLNIKSTSKKSLSRVNK